MAATPSLRIAAGRFRGRRLIVPAGLATRPTGARVREAAFDIVAHGVDGADLGGKAVPMLDGATVLDVFAGAGAMGFEALSRGAAFVTFIESAGPARRAIEHNAATLDIADQVRVLRADAIDPPSAQAGDAATIVFLDPPYRRGLSVPALSALAARGWLAPPALIVVEHEIGETVTAPPGFLTLKRRSYGDVGLLFLAFEGAD